MLLSPRTAILIEGVKPLGGSSGTGNRLIDNLLAYWKMDEATGQTRADVLGTSDLTDVNSNTVGAAGKINNCAAFNGTAGWILKKVNDTILGPPAITIAGWISTNSTFIGRSILNRGDASTTGYNITNNSGDQVRWQYGGVGLTTGNVLTSGVFAFIAATADSSGIGLRVNVTDFVQAGTPNAMVATADFSFTDIFGVTPPNCQCDEFGIWNVVLTGAEIDTLRNGGAGISYPFV
jgi:hypothetical protein